MRHLCILLSTLFVAACTYPRAQLMFSISADNEVTRNATQYRLELWGPPFLENNAPIVSARWNAADAAIQPTLQVVVAQRSRIDDEYIARITAIRSASSTETTLAIARVRSRFVSGRVVTVPVHLYAGCTCADENKTCAASQSNECVDATIPVDRLVDFHPLDAGSLDASGTSALDASLPDASQIDTSQIDTSPPDVGASLRDAGADTTTEVGASACRACGGNACAVCPSDANAANFTCSGNFCIIETCRPRFLLNAARTMCTLDVSPFSGGPLALTQPAGAREFGQSVSLSQDGNTIVVGDRLGRGNPNDAADGRGAATVYKRVQGVWGNGVNLSRSSSASEFGRYTAIAGDGDTVLVGDSTRGSASWYAQSNGVWSGEMRLVPPMRAYAFGKSVSISRDGNTLVVGDHESGVSRFGAATVYVRMGEGWSTGIELTPPEGILDFGSSVALSADGMTVVVGDSGGGGYYEFGAATVYVRDGDAWSAGVVLAPPRSPQDFGNSVAIAADGNTILVGDWRGGVDRDGGTVRPGTVTVYQRVGGTWSGGVELEVPSDARFFGQSVAIAGDGRTLVVGDHDGGGDRNGAATVYHFVDARWMRGNTLVRPSGALSFGYSVALSLDGNTIAVGDVGGDGAVSIYTR